MTSLTVHLQDDSILPKVAKVARQKNTSVEAMVCGFLVSLSEESPGDMEVRQRREAVAALERTFQTLSRDLGGKGYLSRDELHER